MNTPFLLDWTTFPWPNPSPSRLTLTEKIGHERPLQLCQDWVLEYGRSIFQNWKLLYQ